MPIFANGEAKKNRAPVNKLEIRFSASANSQVRRKCCTVVKKKKHRQQKFLTDSFAKLTIVERLQNHFLS